LKYLLFIILFVSQGAFAQQKEYRSFSCTVFCNKRPLVLQDVTYTLPNGSTIQFETFKFYISNIQWMHKGELVYVEPTSFHLIDVSDTISQTIVMHIPVEIKTDTILFQFGIDSLTNASGAKGGDLDPTMGMYWTWHSGYIHLKMEGACSNCIPPKNKFEFHIGGYQYPFNTQQTVALPITSRDCNVVFDLDTFFTKVNVDIQKSIMSPCADAVLLSQQLATCFRIK
jgi:hypothetical protein